MYFTQNIFQTKDNCNHKNLRHEVVNVSNPSQQSVICSWTKIWGFHRNPPILLKKSNEILLLNTPFSSSSRVAYSFSSATLDTLFASTSAKENCAQELMWYRGSDVALGVLEYSADQWICSGYNFPAYFGKSEDGGSNVALWTLTATIDPPI